MAASNNTYLTPSDGFISLQDICKLHILFNLDLFPDYSICQLPRSIRNGLFRILPIFDRLHYENAQFLSDLDIEDICPPHKDEFNGRELYGSNDNIKKKLVSYLFSSPRNLMKEGCGLNLAEASNFINCLPSSITSQDQTLIDDRFNFMKQYRCKVFKDPSCYLMQHITSLPLQQRYLVVPTRLMTFLSTSREQYGPLPMNMFVTNLQLFLSYCNLHSTVPLRQTTLSIDTIQLLDSPIYSEYKTIRESAIQEHRSSSSTGVPIVNPISPLLQDILSSVEHLSIGTNEYFEPSTYDEEELSIDAPYFILTNIVSHKKPRLKSIHVHGIPQPVIDAVATVGGFLCGVEDCPITGINDRYTAEWYHYSLVPPSKSCSITKLKITAVNGDKDYIVQYLLASYSATICDIVKRILEHQKATLKCLALTGVGYTYESLETSSERLNSSSLNFEEIEIVNCDEYRFLLNTTLVNFVQLPQFESLELGDSPDTECYPLILAFMTTPTSHEQKLVISLRPDSKPTISDWCEQYPIPTALPHSNIQFKSLVLDSTERSKLVQHLFGFPDLPLRFLRFSTVNLEGKVPSAGVNIESLMVQVDSEVIDVSKLNVFIGENPVLKHLTVSQAPYGRYNSSIFSVLNECLLRMVNKQISLDSITLQEIQLSKHIKRETYEMRERQLNQQPPAQGLGLGLGFGLQPSPDLPLGIQPSSFTGSDEEGYDFTKWMPSQQEVDLGTWFATLPDGSDNIPSEVLDKDIFLFLCLVQKLNATLTIVPGLEYFQPEHLEYNLIPSLEKSFKKLDVKIRKIIVKGNLKEFKESFMRIATTVETIN